VLGPVVKEILDVTSFVNRLLDMDPIGMPHLVQLVNERASEPLDRVAAALEVSGNLAKLGDRLVGYFIDEARTSNCSWSTIGERLGVSKQAAQQRYTARWAALTVSDIETTTGFGLATGRVKTALRRAEAAAIAQGKSTIETDDVLLGLIEDDAAVATVALSKLGATPTRVRSAFKRPKARASTVAEQAELPLGGDVRKALDLAGDESMFMFHNYIGTEHVLLGLLREGDGAAAKTLSGLGVTLEGARTTCLELINEYAKKHS
jgi:hypothetical protein